MAARYSGPLFGPLPEIDEAWTLVNDQGDVVWTAEDTLEVVRDAMRIPVAYTELMQLSNAMNSCAQLSTRAVQAVKRDLGTHTELLSKVEALKQEVAAGSNLPMVKADVVEYSDKALKAGTTEVDLKVAPLTEELARLEIKICLALDFEAFGLKGPCCDADGYMHGQARLQRS